jgi:hypothetical protein
LVSGIDIDDIIIPVYCHYKIISSFKDFA